MSGSSSTIISRLRLINWIRDSWFCLLLAATVLDTVASLPAQQRSPAEQVTVSHGSMCVLCVQFCVTVIPTLFVEETFVR